MTNDERAREAIEHLQRAALELIAAARAVLDVAEDLVKDPAPIVAMAAAAAAHGRETAATAAGSGAVPTDAGSEPAPRVEHIAVS